MGSHIDTLWLFALATKSNHFTLTHLIASLLFLTLTCLTIALLYWAHPGGPAWGKHSWTHLSKWSLKPIPGPMGFPFLGSIALRTGLAHRKIAAMANRCGAHAKRLMAFSVGETRVIVTCNPHVAKEILNSPAFLDRPHQESAYGLMFNRAIGFSPYGTYWQTLRRVGSVHMFGPKQMKESEAYRRDIASQMISNLLILEEQNGAFPVRELLKTASLSNMMGSVFGRSFKLENDKAEEIQELKQMVDQGYDLLGILNFSDHFSLLADFDFQKVRFRCSQLVPKVNRFITRIITEHRSNPAQMNRDFVDVLLSLQHPLNLSDSDMIAVLWEMIFRGTDATAVLIEWILARLMIHPDVQSRVHDELDKVVGRSRAVEESDLPSLVYLTAVIKEVLRMNPPGPLLAWSRLSIEDTTVDGYHVPAGTTATVNMWAIARDPEVWASPLQFDPDRFLNPDPEKEFSVLGSDLRLAPFGSGRRSCPGKVMGLTTVSIWVASLLQKYEWMAPVNTEIDLSEKLRLSCEMVHPLVAQIKSRII